MNSSTWWRRDSFVTSCKLVQVSISDTTVTHPMEVSNSHFFQNTSPIVRGWKMPTDWHLLIMVKFVKIDGQIFRRKRLFIRLLSPARGCWRKLLSDPIAPSITSSYHQVNTLRKTVTNNGFQDYEEDEKPLPEDLGEMAPPIPKEDDWGAILGWCLSSGSITVTLWFVCLESKDFQHSKFQAIWCLLIFVDSTHQSVEIHDSSDKVAWRFKQPPIFLVFFTNAGVRWYMLVQYSVRKDTTF